MHYDAYDINRDIRLDLPFREMSGALTQDVASHHYNVTLVNTPAWTTLDSYLGCITWDGSTEYGFALNADTVSLGFTTESYSIGMWLFWASGGGSSSQILIGRYQVDVGGWELYLYDNTPYILTLRQHHAAGATTRTACYSDSWTQNVWHFLGVSKSGTTASFYRATPGVADLTELTTTCSVGGMIDPEATTSDLVIAARYSKNADFYNGMIWRPRVWARALTFEDWGRIYEREVRWFLS